MGIASFSQSPVVSVFLAPLHTLAAWLVPAPANSRQFAVPANAPRSPHQLALPFAWAAGGAKRGRTHAHGAKLPSAACAEDTATPGRLKVVRVVDAAVSPACAGRMVISGRMADVCAELERMAQRELAAH